MLYLTLWLSIAACEAEDVESISKQVVGETALIEIHDISLQVLARIDSGARMSSLHAINVEVEDGVINPKENVGKTVRFTTLNGDGEERQVKTQIVKVSKVRNAQGVEYRYVVKMDVQWQGKVKNIGLNLRDRTKLKYKLLMGRNWLHGDYLIDVDTAEQYGD
jgi:hypothetical protein